MKAAIIEKQGSPVATNVRIVDDWPQPMAKPSEAIVRTEAAALNQLDLHVGRGLPGLSLTYPRISGADGVGIVESIGTGVDQSWIGQRVLLNAEIPKYDAPLPTGSPTAPDRMMIGEHTSGTMAKKFAAPIANLLPIGECDPAKSAAFGLTYLTAWRMLWSRARVQPGQWVLITGIGGGVALAALNIAKHLNCKTIVTSRHQSKLDRARELGADFTILDQGDDWSKTVRSFTGKRGVDVCIDSIGKAVHLACVKSLARGGTLVTCGTTSGADAVTDLARVFWNQLNIIGSTMGNMDEFRSVFSLYAAGSLSPVIDQVFEWNDAASAYARLETAEQFGKVVVRWS